MTAVLNPQVQRVNTIVRSGSCTVDLALSEPVAIVADDIKVLDKDQVQLIKNDNEDTNFVFAKVDTSWKAPDLSFGSILQYQISFDTEMRPTGEESSNNTEVGPNNNSSAPSVKKRQTSTGPDSSDSRITTVKVYSCISYVHK